MVDDSHRVVGDADPFAEAGGDLQQDLNTLINYGTDCCVCDFQERAAIERRKAKAEFMAGKERHRVLDCSSTKERAVM